MPIKMSNYNYAGYEAVSQEVGMGGYYGYMCVFKKAKSAKTSRLCGKRGGGGKITQRSSHTGKHGFRIEYHHSNINLKK